MLLINDKTSLENVINKYKCYATDYDGTIIDSMPMWLNFASRYLESKHIKANSDLDMKMKYISNLDAARIIHEEYGVHSSANDVLNDINSFISLVYPSIPLKNNSKYFLKLLKENGKNLLSSATPKQLLESSANSQNILMYYDDIYSSSDLDLSKESGKLFSYILEKENIKPDELLVIEDSIMAMKACHKLGISTLIVYDNSNKDDMDLISKYATYYVNLETLK